MFGSGSSSILFPIMTGIARLTGGGQVIDDYSLRGLDDEAFRRQVHRARASRRNEDLEHTCREWALIAIKEVLKAAAEERLTVRIASRTFFPNLFDQLSENLEEIFSKNVQVHALILRNDAPNLESNSFIQTILSRPELGEVKQLKESKETGSFILAGEQYYRAATEDGRNRSGAVVNFGNPRRAAELAKTFSELSKSETISLKKADLAL